ncbi:methylenetetrahydrofolate reductase [Candidatus Vidania fulgoroideorum]
MISFEILPPINKNFTNLTKFEKLRIINPDFFSVTFSSKRFVYKTTIKFCIILNRKLGVKIIPHIPCYNMKCLDIITWINIFKNSGINSILPLRGDKIGLIFKNSINLIRFLNRNNPKLNIYSTTYPEIHKDCVNNYKFDIYNLKKKNKFTNKIFTQIFIDLNAYYFFIKKIIRYNIMPNLIMGVMSFRNLEFMKKMSYNLNFNIPNIIKINLNKNFIKEYILNIMENIKIINYIYKPKKYHIYTMNNFYLSEKIALIIKK